jgi:hypothetical protein
MESKLTRFLRSGGGGAVVIGHGATPWDRGRAADCLKERLINSFGFAEMAV